MGADIHFYVERRDDNRWIKCDAPRSSNRNYAVFTALADVRRETSDARGYKIETICEPKGLPEDCSDEVRDRCLDDYHHSHSWLTIAECLEYKGDPEGIVDSFFKEYLAEIIAWCEANKVKNEDIRFVFYFDN